jgi:hypothetical protein
MASNVDRNDNGLDCIRIFWVVSSGAKKYFYRHLNCRQSLNATYSCVLCSRCILAAAQMFKLQKTARRVCCAMLKHTSGKLAQWASVELSGSLWTVLVRVDTG